jgi:hypothetical protein
MATVRHSTDQEEVRMTEYNLKMINHAGVSSDRRGEIEVQLQAILDEAFDASSDSVFVGWGAQSESDTIRLHHVRDVGASVIVKYMERPPTLRPGIAGHTSKRGKLVGSEFYKDVSVMSRGKLTATTQSAQKTAGLVFHECLHNVAPDFSEEQIAALGGYGKSPPETVMTDKLREHMTTRIATKRPQLLVKP